MSKSTGKRTGQSGWSVAAALRTELLFAPCPRIVLGIGSRACASLTSWLDPTPPRGVLLAGFCGGLRASLAAGDLVLADRVSDAEGEVTLAPNAVAWAAALLPDAHVGSLVTVSHVAALEEKARLGLASLVVDMESAPLARELAARGVPFLTLRVVLDALWEEVPSGLGRVTWSARALTCARRLGLAARLLANAPPSAANEGPESRRLHVGRGER
jgi:hypothetical protein